MKKIYIPKHIDSTWESLDEVPDDMPIFIKQNEAIVGMIIPTSTGWTYSFGEEPVDVKKAHKARNECIAEVLNLCSDLTCVINVTV